MLTETSLVDRDIILSRATSAQGIASPQVDLRYVLYRGRRYDGVELHR